MNKWKKWANPNERRGRNAAILDAAMAVNGGVCVNISDVFWMQQSISDVTYWVSRQMSRMADRISYVLVS